MNCPKCGRPLERGAHFCGACGTRVASNSKAQRGRSGNSAGRSTGSKKSGGSKGLVIALACVIGLGILAIAIFGTMLFMNSRKPSGALDSEPAMSYLPTEEAPPQTEQPTEPTAEQSTPTETESEPAPTETTEDKPAGIDADTQYKLNLFLSNFSESFFGNWEAGNDRYASFDRIMFIFSWYNLNKNDQLKFSEDYDAMLSYEQVNERHQRFFGESLSKPSDGARFTNEYGERIYFQDGYFMTPWGAGESHADFTVARSITDNGDGTYTVEFDVYTAEDFNSGGDRLTDESYYRLTPDNVKTRNVSFRYSGRAIVVPYKSGSVDSYQLRAYFRD